MRRGGTGDRRTTVGAARRGHLGVDAVAAAALVLLAVACTAEPGDTGPVPVTPPPVEEAPANPAGRDVEVVLPARSTLDAGLARALEARLAAVDDDRPAGVDRVTVRIPDTVPFVADLLEFAAARRAGMVCAFGPSVAAPADTVARRHGATTVCAAPRSWEEPGEDGTPPAAPSVAVDLPVTELGVLVGTAARTAAVTVATAAAAAAAAETAAEEEGAPTSSSRPSARIDPRVGLLLAGDDLPAEAFRTGLVAGLDGVRVLEVEDPEVDRLEALASLLAAGAHVVVVDGGPGAAEILAAVGDGVAVIAPVDLWPEGLPDGAVLGYRIAWEVVLGELLERFAADGGLGAPVRFGLADEVVVTTVGPGWPGVAGAVAAASEQLAAAAAASVPTDGDPTDDAG